MNRLILLVESRIRGDVYVRFGGELPKTHRSNTAGRWMLSLPYFCVGMRFHSVVLQTVLNGKNYILDYTEPQKGKIYGMLDELNIVDVYASRYTSLLDNPDIDNLIIECQRYEADFSLLDDYLNSYSRLLKTIL